MVEKRKSMSPRTKATASTIPPRKRPPSKAPPATGSEATQLAARLAHAEEEIGAMLVQLAKLEQRARRAEQTASMSSDERVKALTAERDALVAAVREAATILLRAITPRARRAPPPPLPGHAPAPSVSIVDVSEIAEMVDSLRPPSPRDA